MLLDELTKWNSHASEIPEKLENKLKKVKSNLSTECEENMLLQENLNKTKYEL